jgi:hypothetical protein
MYYYPYTPKTQPPVHSTFEINSKVRVQEKKAIDLAAWYINKMSSQASPRPNLFRKLFTALTSFIDRPSVAPQGELAPSHQ